MLCLHWVPLGQKRKGLNSRSEYVTREGDERGGNGVREKRKVGKEKGRKGSCEI